MVSFFDAMLTRRSNLEEDRPKPFKSTEEKAIENIAQFLDCDLLTALRAFSNFKKDSQKYAKGKKLSGALLEAFEFQSRLTNLRIEFGSRDPSKLKQRKQTTEALKQVFKKHEKFFAEVKKFGPENWDEIFGSFELCVFENLLEQWAVLQGEIGIREQREAKTARRIAKGRVADDRPVFLAKNVADLFVVLDRNIGVGTDPFNQHGPSTPFGKAVEFTFEQFGVVHNFRRPAQEAANYAKNKYAKK